MDDDETLCGNGCFCTCCCMCEPEGRAEDFLPLIREYAERQYEAIRLALLVWESSDLDKERSESVAAHIIANKDRLKP